MSIICFEKEESDPYLAQPGLVKDFLVEQFLSKDKPGTQLVVLFNSPHLCGQPSIILHPDNFLRTGSMCKE